MCRSSRSLVPRSFYDRFLLKSCLEFRPKRSEVAPPGGKYHRRCARFRQACIIAHNIHETQSFVFDRLTGITRKRIGVWCRRRNSALYPAFMAVVIAFVVFGFIRLRFVIAGVGNVVQFNA